MKKLLMTLSVLAVLATVSWAQKEKLLRLANQIVRAEQPSQTPLPEPASQDKQPQSSTSVSPSLSSMLAALNQLLVLNETQKEEITHQNEKALERLAMARSEQRSAANLRTAEQHIINLRDEQIGKVLTPIQMKKWRIFQKNRNSVSSLKQLREVYQNYQNGTLPFHAYSESKEFGSLEDMVKHINKATDEIKSLGITEAELEEFSALLYNL